MRRGLRHGQVLLASITTICVAVVLAGCGSNAAKKDPPAHPTWHASLPSGAVPIPGGVAGAGTPVVQVGAATLTKAGFEKRMAMEARFESPKAPIETVAPSFSACIAQLAGSAPKSTVKAPPAVQQYKTPCRELYEKRREHVLENVVTADWLIGGVSELGVPVSDAEARERLVAQIETSYPSEAAFQKYLRLSGENISDLLFTAQAELASARIRNKVESGAPHATPATIASYYKANKTRYAIAEQRDVGMIKTKRASVAAQVKRELIGGRSFAKIAKRLAKEQPFYMKEGLLAELEPNVFKEKQLNNAIFKAPLHVVTGPIRLNLNPGFDFRSPQDIQNIDGYYVFAVEAIRPFRQKTLSEVEPGIKKELPAELQRQALAAYIHAWRGRWRPKTTCQPGYVIQKCREFKALPTTQAEDPYTLN